jgi:PucR-like helix-turn-helix protein
MQSDRSTPPPGRPPARYADLLRRAIADLDRIGDRVAADVAGPGEAVADVLPEVRAAIDRLVDALDRGPEPSAEVLAGLREEGAAAARAGLSVERVIDRYLSAGWVMWDAAADRAAGREEIAALGAALLRTGDLAAAAIAEGFGSADREIAGRQAVARDELLDDLLAAVPGDAESVARLTRRAAAVGFDPDVAHTVVVVAGAAGSLDSGSIETRLARPARSGRSAAGPTLVGARNERLVVVAAVGPQTARALETLARAIGDRSYGARSTAAPGVARVGPAYLAASSALSTMIRLDRPGVIVDAADVLVERVLGTDDELLAALVEHELGPLVRAGRGSHDLLRTLDAWLDAGLNAQATARALDVAPRTVAYRLERISHVLGTPLDGPTVRRLGVALTGRRLLPRSIAPGDDGSG